MATTAYTIYSHYDPEDREALERETGQTIINVDGDEEWQSEAVKAFKRKQAPPRFVPATKSNLSVDDWTRSNLRQSSNSKGLSEWYRSMVPADTKPIASSSSSRVIQSKLEIEKQKPTKNDWFIQKALSSSQSSAHVTFHTPKPSLADMLARDPPNTTPFKPPVFLTLGPSNKGFAMLQNKGWNEGEALGLSSGTGIVREEKQDLEIEVEVDLEEGDGEIMEIRKISVVDLTGSDSEAEDDQLDSTTLTSIEDSNYGRKALLTPLPTVLKSDRLGIGLKAKTVPGTGPFKGYKTSMKRVTHNAAALAAHYHQAEEARKRKSRWGKGQRGFAKRDKEEQGKRRELLAYMNS